MAKTGDNFLYLFDFDEFVGERLKQSLCSYDRIHVAVRKLLRFGDIRVDKGTEKMVINYFWGSI